MRYVLLFVLVSSVVGACYAPSDGELINVSRVLCSDTFDAPNGILVSGNDFLVDCNTAVIRGVKGSSNIGLAVKNARNVTIKDCNVVTFENGMLLENVSHSRIIGNNLLKNSVGIRLFDSFENVLDNNDKSLVKSVSAINARYNAVQLGNKGVEEGFCDVNACNTDELPAACREDGWCYPPCEQDPDCAPIELAQNTTPRKSAEQIIEEFEKEVYEKRVIPEPQLEHPLVSRVVPWYLKIFIYLGAYLVSFVLIQLYAKKR